MAVIRWNPFTEFEHVRSEMDQLWQLAGSEGSRLVSRRDTFPLIEIIDHPDHLLVRAELAGIKREDIRLYGTYNKVTIEGERYFPSFPSETIQLRNERSYGQFKREIELPSQIDNNQTTAKMKDGILEIFLPKREKEQQKEIEIIAEERIDP